MSIRTKLLLSYIAMIIIPIVVFMSTSILLFALFFKDLMGNDRLSSIREGRRLQEFANGMMQLNQWSEGLGLVSRYNPDLLTDDDFLRKADEEMRQVKSGFAVEKDHRLIYASSMIDTPDLYERISDFMLESRGYGKRYGHHKFEMNGNSYSVSAYQATYSDQSKGAVYFFENTGKYAAFSQSFFPLLFLFLLVVLGLTNGLLTYLVSRSIIRPLNELKKAAEHIKEGDLDHELKMGRKDELGELSQTFEEMRLRLRESIRIQLQYEENRKELVSNISHDLKTPITAITGCVEGLRDGIADTPEKRMKYIDMIHKKTSDMDRLIDELMMYSKLDLKRLPFLFEKVDINAMLDDYADELRLNPKNAGVIFKYDRLARPVYAIADREKLGRVVANIVDNSLKHMDKQDGAVTFELQDGREEVTVAIADNGRGIGVQSLPYIFERFYRADPSRNTSTGGSGLGLAIVKQIVEEHGGKVWADSTEGQGTRIAFTLKKSERRSGEGEGEAYENDIDH